MSLVRYSSPLFTGWTPFDRLSSLHSELNRLFDFSAPTLSGWTPALDVYEEADSFVVQVEVPGLKPEDVHLELKDGVLTVTGERKTATEANSGKAFRSERQYGKFERSVTLPALVDGNNV